MKPLLSLVTLLLVFMFNSCQNPVKENKLSGPYLGQTPPGRISKVFAPGIVSSRMGERDLTISPDGNEIYWCVTYGRSTAIVGVKQIDGVWTKPEVAPFSGHYSDVEPYIQRDGKKMYFVSRRPLVTGEENKDRYNIWYMDKTETGWSEPNPLGEPINGHGSVFFPTLTKTGTMYFTRATDSGEYIFRSKMVDGKFTEPERLPDIVNRKKNQYNTFISYDEDFLIVPSTKEGTRSDYYYVFFRDENDNWSEAIELGKEINNGQGGWTPQISPDGKYFFFMGIEPGKEFTKEEMERGLTYADLLEFHDLSIKENTDIYWIESSVITELNPFTK